MISVAFHKVIHRATSLREVEKETVSAMEELGWSPAARQVIARIAVVLADHVIRHAGDGHLRVMRTGKALEIVSEDRGAGFLRIYTAIRETGLAEATRAGIYEVENPEFGGLSALRALADELHLECEPGRGMTVRVVLNGEPANVPHSPCPCLVVNGRSRAVGRLD